MAVSPANLDSLLNASFPDADYTSVSFQSETGAYSTVTLNTTGVPGPGTFAGEVLQVVGINDAANSITVAFSYNGQPLSTQSTFYVVGYSSKGVLLSGVPAKELPSPPPPGYDAILNATIGVLSSSSVPAGTNITFSSSGSSTLTPTPTTPTTPTTTTTPTTPATTTTLTTPATTTTPTTPATTTTPTTPAGSTPPTTPTAPNAPPAVPLPPNNGLSPTPLSASDQTTVNLADSFGQQVGAASMTFIDGTHIGADFSSLGAAAAAGENPGPFNNQLFSDLKAFLSDWGAAEPGLTTGISTPGGPPVILPAQFVLNLVNDGLNAITGGAGSVDQTFGGAVSQYFGIDRSFLLTHTA